MPTSGFHLERDFPEIYRFYRTVLHALKESGIPFLIGGAYALQRFTEIVRDTKDLDVFVKPEDAQRTLDMLARQGFLTEMTFPHWLGKVFHDAAAVDVIFSSGNGLVRVDEAWFRTHYEETVLDVPVRLCAPEDMIRSKAYIMERERYDGADIAHLVYALAGSLDWRYLVDRFGDHWRVLLTHLVLFGFIYPGERSRVPGWVMRELMDRLRDEEESSVQGTMLCQGTLLSREQYLEGVHRRGFKDARLEPSGFMSEQDVAHWTAAISKTEPH